MNNQASNDAHRINHYFQFHLFEIVAAHLPNCMEMHKVIDKLVATDEVLFGKLPLTFCGSHGVPLGETVRKDEGTSANGKLNHYSETRYRYGLPYVYVHFTNGRRHRPVVYLSGGLTVQIQYSDVRAFYAAAPLIGYVLSNSDDAFAPLGDDLAQLELVRFPPSRKHQTVNLMKRLKRVMFALYKACADIDALEAIAIAY